MVQDPSIIFGFNYARRVAHNTTTSFKGIINSKDSFLVIANSYLDRLFSYERSDETVNGYGI